MGPFPKAPDGFKFLCVAVDKSTKWIEPEPVREITATTTIKVHMSAGSALDSLSHINTDNGTRFSSWESHTGRLEQPAIWA